MMALVVLFVGSVSLIGHGMSLSSTSKNHFYYITSILVYDSRCRNSICGG